MPTSMTAPISTMTLTGVAVARSPATTPTTLRDAEHNDERMDQRLEGGRHHQVDEEDRESQGELQAGERGLHLLALAAELGADARRRRELGEERVISLRSR